MTVRAYDVANKVDVLIEVSEEVRRTLASPSKLSLGELRDNPDFDNEYMSAWDSFLDGGHLYADGVEYMEYNVDGYTVRFERDAVLAENQQ